MAVSTDMPRPSRRRFLVTAPAAAVAVGNLIPKDASLKAIFARWERKNAEVEASHHLSDKDWDVLTDELTEIEREVYACPAEGLDGLAIKARVAQQYVQRRE